jgi:hypothetical protein
MLGSLSDISSISTGVLGGAVGPEIFWIFQFTARTADYLLILLALGLPACPEPLTELV